MASRGREAASEAGTVTTSVSLSALSTSDSTQHRTTVPSTHGVEPDLPVEPDRYDEKKEGWLVVLASSAIFFVYLGITYSYGIVQLHLAEAQLANVSTLSFIGGISSCISPLTGLIIARIMRKFGHRITVFLGGVLTGLGEFTAGWSTHSLAGMFITQGFVFGAGAALCFLPAATVPSLWFKQRRGLATGVVYSGAGLGAAVVTLTLDRLISSVGLPKALRILGLAAWGICLPAAYFIKAPDGTQNPVLKMQWHLLKNLKFWILCIMSVMATFPIFVPPFLLPLYTDSIGLSNGTGAIILATWNFSSAMGRILMGIVADSLLGPTNSLFVALLVNGLSIMVIWPFSTSVGTLILFAILNGAGSGGFFSLMPVVTGGVFGSGLVANAFSMLVTAWASGYFMGAPVAGYLLENYGGKDGGLAAFRPAIFYAGSLTFGSAGLVLAVRLLMNRKLMAKV